MAATDLSRTSSLATGGYSTIGNGETASSTTTTAAAATTVDNPNASPRPSTGSDEQTTRSGMSGGAVAGAVIGTAVGVALLTFALTCWMVRRGSRKRGLQRQKRRSSELSDHYVKRSGTSASGERRRGGWQEHLPQSLDDPTVRRRVKTVLDQAAVHVENNFSDINKAGRESEVEDTLAAFQTPHLPAPLPALIGQSRRPTLLIKHALAYSLVASSDFLLPPTLTELPRVVDGRPDRPRAASQALSHWRRLTAYLHPAPAADQSFLAHRNARIENQVDHFLVAFEPWLSSNPAADRRQNLIAIFHAAADVSYMLFSQPSALDFDWAARPDGAVVSLPGLLKLTDENGSPLPYSHVLLQPTVVSSF